jgi:hypothetical protein
MRVASNGDIRAPKNFFHNSLYKRCARTGIEQKRANQSQLIRCARSPPDRFLRANAFAATDSFANFEFRAAGAEHDYRTAPNRRARATGLAQIRGRVSFSGSR